MLNAVGDVFTTWVKPLAALVTSCHFFITNKEGYSTASVDGKHSGLIAITLRLCLVGNISFICLVWKQLQRWWHFFLLKTWGHLDHFLGTEQVQWLWKVDTTVHITLWMHRLNMYFLLVDMDGCSEVATICFLVSFVRFVLLTLQ